MTAASDVRRPEQGARLLFLTGGSALRDLSRRLKLHTHNSIHVVTAFDSGGSSAPLRQAFGMPAIGDIRNRLLALVDETGHYGPRVAQALSFRLSETSGSAAQAARCQVLHDLVQRPDGLQAQLPEDMAAFACQGIAAFLERMPNDFDLRLASIGNLVLAGHVLLSAGDLEGTIARFSELVGVRGHVVPVVSEDVTLVARLQDDSLVVGQHRITGNGAPAIAAAVQELYLVEDAQEPECHAEVHASRRAQELLRSADLICYPMGSLYSSVIANLLPHGVCDSIHAATCPKVYVPSAGCDPEALGLSLAERVHTLLRYASRASDANHAPIEKVLHTVLLDLRNVDYGELGDLASLEALGVTLLDLPLATRSSATRLEADLLTQELLGLATSHGP